MDKKRGFTLIELMVVIAIMAILATVGLVTYSNAQKSSRDARRKDDLKQIAIALELYKQKNGHYPSPWISDNSDGGGFSVSTDPQASHTPWMFGLDSSYLSQVPLDPINNASFQYTYDPATISTTTGPATSCPGIAGPLNPECCTPSAYYLVAILENSQGGNVSQSSGPLSLNINFCSTPTSQITLTYNGRDDQYVVWGK